MKDLVPFLQSHNALSHTNAGITICSVTDAQAGGMLAKALVYELVTPKTTIYLSGGKTPKKLYAAFAQEEIFSPGAVGVVDERYGEPFHAKSNELMFKETELLRYLQIRGIPFYPMLQAHIAREQVAQLYDEQVRSLHALFPQSVALLGIGTDAHTAGIAPNTASFKNPVFSQEQKHAFVSSFTDPKRFYGQRVTMTFLGLAMIDVLVLLVFGDDKKEALDAMFREGSEEEIPSRFYKRPEIAHKTIMITDQSV